MQNPPNPNPQSNPPPTTSSAARPPSAAPPAPPAVLASTPGLRPSYGLGLSDKEREREREKAKADLSGRYTYSSSSSMFGRRDPTPSANPAAPHTHSYLASAPHHHHHHHHHHSTPSTTPSSSVPPSGTTPATSTVPRRADLGVQRTSIFGGRSEGSAYGGGMFTALGDQEAIKRERLAAVEREREAERQDKERRQQQHRDSPPRDARDASRPASSTPAVSTASASASASAAQPSKQFPSPFFHGYYPPGLRPPGSQTPSDAGHRRTPSGSTPRDAAFRPLSPPKQGALPPPRSTLSATPSSATNATAPLPSRSPVQSTRPPPAPASQADKPAAPAGGVRAGMSGYSSSLYQPSTYTSYSNSSYSASFADRKPYDLGVPRPSQAATPSSQAEWERKRVSDWYDAHAPRKPAEPKPTPAQPAAPAHTEATPFQPPRQTAPSYDDPYRAHFMREQNREKPAEPAQPREARPYGYKPETSREYAAPPVHTQPAAPARDKRPRMDAAVEEQAQAHRRGSATKAKRRKDDEKKASPAVPPRDYASLALAVKKWPEVSSAPVETWLRSTLRPTEVQRFIPHEAYGGPGWSLADSAALKRAEPADIVIVRVNGSFLGQHWRTRGEAGWSSGYTELPANRDDAARIGLGWTDETVRHDRKVWGTDVYTDDSDFGLVLLHAGWVRWCQPHAPRTPGEMDSDVLLVHVRITPPQVRYVATERYGLQSRAWGNRHDGASIVIEHVDRVKISDYPLKRADARATARSQVGLNRRQMRKHWMREHARERAARYGAVTSSVAEDIVERPIGAEEPSLSLSIEGGGLEYDLAVLAGWLDRVDTGDDVDIDAAVPAKAAAPSIWTHDLVLQHFQGDTYHLSQADSAFTLVRLAQRLPTRAGAEPAAPAPAPAETLGDKLEAGAYHWTDAGLAVQREEGSVLVPVSMWRWAPRA
ncbi:hypothetical protein Q5752_006030 [Cryptotrichosporon argae]